MRRPERPPRSALEGSAAITSIEPILPQDQRQQTVPRRPERCPTSGETGADLLAQDARMLIIDLADIAAILIRRHPKLTDDLFAVPIQVAQTDGAGGRDPSAIFAGHSS